MKWAAAIAGMVLWAAISITGAQAATAWAIGHGTQSCGQYIKDQQGNHYSEMAEKGWFDGFLSSYTVYSSDDIELPDTGARYAWLNNYCQNHPLDELYKAAEQLLLELERRGSQH